MKTLLIALTLLASTFALATPTDAEIELSAKVYTLKMMIETNAESFEGLADDLADLADRKDNLGFFNLSRKTRINREACALIKASTGTSLLMIGVSLEMLQGQEIGDDKGEAVEELTAELGQYIAESKAAIENCTQINVAKKHIVNAERSLTHSLEIIDEVFGETIIDQIVKY